MVASASLQTASATGAGKHEAEIQSRIPSFLHLSEKKEVNRKTQETTGHIENTRIFIFKNVSEPSSFCKLRDIVFNVIIGSKCIH